MRRPLTAMTLIILGLILVSMSNTDAVSAEGETVVIRGASIPLTARLLQNGTYGNPVPNQIIDFYDELLGTYLGSDVTDSNGYASIIWNIPSNHPLGITIINATFAGNATLSLAPSFQYAFVHVVSNTQISIQNLPETIYPGDDLSFTVLLQNDLGEAIAGAILAVSTDNTQIAIASTNVTGYAIFSFQCNASWCHLGLNELRVVYEEDLVGYNSGYELDFQINIEQIQSSISIESTIPYAVNLTDTFQIQVLAETVEGYLQDTLLGIYLDDIPIDTITTDALGYAGYTLNVDSRFSLGKHTLRIYFNGSERYTTTHAETTIEVESPISIDITKPEYSILGLENEFGIEVSDVLNRPIQNATITIHDPATNTDYVEQVPPGHISLIIALLFEGPVGPRSLTISVSGNDFITNKSHSFDLTIWLQPELTLIESSILGYASPSQRFSLEIQLNGIDGGLPDKVLEVLNHQGTPSEVLVTDSIGLVHFSITAPDTIGDFTIALIYTGMQSEYELSTTFYYSFKVRRIIPVMVQLDYYEVISPAQEIFVRFVMRGYNGSFLQGIGFTYTWTEFTVRTISQSNGIIDIHLPVPGVGAYILYYESEESPTLESCSGNITITISGIEAIAAQGVGISGFVVSITLSLALVGIPVIYRKYMIG
ncbi:MAG: hypothetical protein ACFFAY_00035 [Promethearchaeota archaeon]